MINNYRQGVWLRRGAYFSMLPRGAYVYNHKWRSLLQFCISSTRVKLWDLVLYVYLINCQFYMEILSFLFNISVSWLYFSLFSHL